MKQVTLNAIYKTEHFLSRAIIDRRVKKPNAVIEEQRNITRECNGNVLPAYLYNYYISICQIPSWDLTNDSMVAKQLGVSIRKIADTRRLLTKLGWIRFDTHTHRGTSYGMWYIGKEVVATKVGLETPLEDYVAVGIVTEEEYQTVLQLLEEGTTEDD